MGQQQELREQLADLPEPLGSPIDAQVAAQRKVCVDSLAVPATVASIKATKAEIGTLEKLIADAEEKTRETRKKFAARIDPVTRRHRKLGLLLDELGIGSRIADVKAEYEAVRTAQAAGKWDEAAAKAEALAVALNPLDQLAKGFSAFRNDGKLLHPTYDKIVKSMPNGFTAPQLRQRLDDVYRQQCSVTRLNWMEFLGIAGKNVKNGSDDAHYTTFNDAVMKGGNTLDVSGTIDQLCVALFESVNSTAQVHATVTYGAERYHKYWDGTESYNVYRDNLMTRDRRLYDRMVAIWTRMKTEMTDKVGQAQAAHGRIGNASRGPDV